MKIAVAALAASLAFTVLPSAWAAGEAPAAADAPATTAPAPSRAEQLDTLFGKLKSAKDDAAARQAEDAIIAIWLQSGSDTVDLLMSWGVQAIAAKHYAEALDILDRVVTLKPDYAEGWNKRATVYYLTDKYGRRSPTSSMCWCSNHATSGHWSASARSFAISATTSARSPPSTRRWRSTRISNARKARPWKRRPAGHLRRRPARPKADAANSDPLGREQAAAAPIRCRSRRP